MGRVFARLPKLPLEQANDLVVTEVFGRLDAQVRLPGLVEIINPWRSEVAEIPFNAFSSRKKADQVAGRLVVRWIPDPNPATKAARSHCLTRGATTPSSPAPSTPT
jgi:hypothetical protein